MHGETITQTHFSDIGRPTKVWSIPAIHAQLEQLTRIHDHILEHIKPGERILYHGNYTGYGVDAVNCIHEILAFRRMVLAIPGFIPSDIIYLKGRQELIWEKLFQLHYAPDPVNVFLWMLGNGLSETLNDYGISRHDGLEACKAGCISTAKWLNVVRKAIGAQAGHETFIRQFKRGAFTSQDTTYPMLFVHAGLNPVQTLCAQGDNLWWGAEHFENMDRPYKPFEKVVRGFDPEHRGMHLNCITATVDDGCGFGGNLISVGFEEDGSASTILEA